MVLEKFGEDEFVIQRLHQGLPADRGHGADERRVLKLLLVGGKRQDHRGTRHDNDVLLRLVGGGEKDVQLIGGRLRRWAPEVHILREARAHLTAEAFMTDQKETPDTAGKQSVCQPRKQGRAHNILQHHRTKISGFCGIVRNENNRGQTCHKRSQPSRARAAAHNRLHYTRPFRVCTGRSCAISNKIFRPALKIRFRRINPLTDVG